MAWPAQLVCRAVFQNQNKISRRRHAAVPQERAGKKQADADAEKKARERAELELIMMEEDGDEAEGFNMKQIKKAVRASAPCPPCAPRGLMTEGSPSLLPPPSSLLPPAPDSCAGGMCARAQVPRARARTCVCTHRVICKPPPP